jgi:hypothetical protein
MAEWPVYTITLSLRGNIANIPLDKHRGETPYLILWLPDTRA